VGKFRQTFWEFGSNAKASATTVHTADLNAGNIAAQLTLAQAFEDALAGVSLGNLGTQEISAVVDEVAKNPSGNSAAQRENKWLVSFVDDVTGLGGSFTIPCYNSALLGGDGETMDTGSSQYTNLVAATEAYVRSLAGNAISVTSVRFTARNL